MLISSNIESTLRDNERATRAGKERRKGKGRQVDKDEGAVTVIRCTSYYGKVLAL